MRASPRSPTILALLALLVATVAWFAFFAPWVLGEADADPRRTISLDDLFADSENAQELAPDAQAAFETPLLGGDEVERRANSDDPEAFADDVREVEQGSGAPRPRAQFAGRIVHENQSVDGARVRIWWRRSGARGVPSPAGSWITTDREGRFSGTFESSRRVDLELLAHKEGLAPKLTRLRNQQTSAQIDFGEIELTPGIRAIGCLMTPEGAPVVSASVEWFGVAGRDARLRDVREPIVSDERGNFELANVPPIRFAVAAVDEERAPTWSRVADPASENGVIDLGTMIMARGAVVQGVVRTQRGVGVAGVQIEARQGSVPRPVGREKRTPSAASELPPQIPARLRKRTWHRVTTDAEGSFELRGLPRSSLEVLARKTGFLDERASLPDGEQLHRLTIEMWPRPRLEGVVVDFVSGKPLERFSIRARRVRGAEIGTSRATESAKARAARDSLAKSKAKLIAAQKKRDAARAAKVATERRQRASQPSKPVSPARAAAIAKRNKRIADKRAAQLAKEKARVEKERRVALARQQASRRRAQWFEERLGPSGQRPRWLPPATQHDAGVFVLDDLEPGTWLLDVGAPEHVAQAWGPIRIIRGTKPAKLTIRLQRGATIEGRVVSKATGKPVPRARVELFAPPPDERPLAPDLLVRAMYPRGPGLAISATRSYGSGAFKLEPQRPGTYRVRVRADGFDSSIRDGVVVSRGRSTKNLDFALVPAARLFGEIRNLPAGKKATVRIASTRGQKLAVTVDERGRYEARNLGAGDYFVRLTIEGEAWGSFRAAYEAIVVPGRDGPDVHLRAGDDRRFDLDATATELARVEGTVRHNGQLARGLALELVPDGRAGPRPKDSRRAKLLRDFLAKSLATKSDANGNFTFDPVPAGRYFLTAQLRGGGKRGLRIGRRLVRVARGRNPKLRVEFTTADLSLRAVDKDSKRPVNGRFVMALSEETAGKEPNAWRRLPSIRIATLRRGRARLPTLAAGTYEWVVFGSGLVTQRGRIEIHGARQLQLEISRARRKR